MPALAPVPGVIRFRVEHTIGAEIRTGYHFYMHTGAAPTQTQLNQAVSAGHTGWINNMKALTGATVTMTNIIATDLSSPTGPVGQGPFVEPGTRAGGQLPAETCVLVNYAIARRYRGGKPRSYIPAGTDTDLQTPQQWTTAFQTAFASGLSSFFVSIQGSLSTWAPGTYLCNVSYYSGHEWKQDQNDNWHRIPLPRPAGPLVDQLLATNVSPILGTQRRRMRQ